MTGPDPEALQVTLLGRGVGECAVVQLPGGDWLVIDSFNHRGKPVALHHLEQIGVSPDRVIGIVITHFHTDHYRMVNELHEACVRARLYITDALHRDRFQAFFHDPTVPGVFEGLPGTVQRARERKFEGSVGFGLVRLKSGMWVENPRGYQVLALSPSERAVDQSDDDLHALIGVVDPQQVRATLRDDNRCSVVLHIDVGFATVLLGADLQSSPQYAGWRALYESHRNLRPAELLKVPHHGSVTSDDPGLWALTLDGAHLNVAPNSGSSLPTAADVERLARQGELWQTGPSTPQEVELLGEEPPPKEPLGWITATRAPDDESWSVATGGTAFRHTVDAASQSEHQ